MKKLFIITLIGIIDIVCFSSCDNAQTNLTSEQPAMCYKEFKYKGHDMVFFKYKWGYSGNVIHSPECKKCFDLYD